MSAMGPDEARPDGIIGEEAGTDGGVAAAGDGVNVGAAGWIDPSEPPAETVDG